MSYSYLATPYTHNDKDVELARFKIVEFMTAMYMAGREHVFSPIGHNHKISRLYAIPTDFNYWQDFNYAMLRHCRELRVLELPGHDRSKGVQMEVDFAELISLPVHRVEWIDIKERVYTYERISKKDTLSIFVDMLDEEEKRFRTISSKL